MTTTITYHSTLHDDLRACTEALRAASLPGVDVLSIVERAIIELEDDQNLNAGKPTLHLSILIPANGLQLVVKGSGSNLTLDGAVECDAAIMDGRTGSFGGVGAVSGASFTFCCLASPEHPRRRGQESNQVGDCYSEPFSQAGPTGSYSSAVKYSEILPIRMIQTNSKDARLERCAFVCHEEWVGNSSP